MSTRLPLLALSLFGAVASASVGTVTAVEGTLTRTPRSGSPSAAPTETALEVGDTLQVSAPGSAVLTLSDESTLMLGPGAKLELAEADFGALDTRRFVARLHLGALWAQVKRALVGSEAKFEVETERAVVGVRGTIFEVEVTGPGEAEFGVEEGEVEVAHAEEGVDAQDRRAWKRHRLVKGEALRAAKRAEKRKLLKKKNAFRRFIDKQRQRRQRLRQQQEHDRQRRQREHQRQQRQR